MSSSSSSPGLDDGVLGGVRESHAAAPRSASRGSRGAGTGLSRRHRRSSDSTAVTKGSKRGLLDGV